MDYPFLRKPGMGRLMNALEKARYLADDEKFNDARYVVNKIFHRYKDIESLVYRHLGKCHDDESLSMYIRGITHLLKNCELSREPGLGPWDITMVSKIDNQNPFWLGKRDIFFRGGLIDDPMKWIPIPDEPEWMTQRVKSEFDFLREIPNAIYAQIDGADRYMFCLRPSQNNRSGVDGYYYPHLEKGNKDNYLHGEFQEPYKVEEAGEDVAIPFAIRGSGAGGGLVVNLTAFCRKFMLACFSQDIVGSGCQKAKEHLVRTIKNNIPAHSEEPNDLKEILEKELSYACDEISGVAGKKESYIKALHQTFEETDDDHIFFYASDVHTREVTPIIKGSRSKVTSQSKSSKPTGALKIPDMAPDFLKKMDAAVEEFVPEVIEKDERGKFVTNLHAIAKDMVKKVMEQDERHQRQIKELEEKVEQEKQRPVEIKAHTAKMGVVHMAWHDRLLTDIRLGRTVAVRGPAGNGKSTGIKGVLESAGYKIYHLDCTDSTVVEQLVGGLEPVPDGKGGIKMAFKDGIFSKAFKDEKGAIQLDEFDALDPRVAMSLQSALHRATSGGKRVVSCPDHPDGKLFAVGDCPIVVSMNTWGTGATREYVGRNALDAASLDRFDSVIDTGYEKEEEILKAYEIEPQKVQKIMYLVRGTRESIQSKGLKVLLSTRRVMNMAEAVKCLNCNPEQAFSREFIERLDEYDRSALKLSVVK